MYAVGTSILYGRMGVCEVESIGAPPFQRDGGRSYYTLRARFSTSGERVYVPVDAAASMRLLIDSGEAAGYLRQMSRLRPQAFPSSRPADLAGHYQQMLSSCQIRDSLLLIKEVYCKQKDLAGRSKKLGQVDARYLKIAERLVCEELAAALDGTPSQMKSRLYEAMEADSETA